MRTVAALFVAERGAYIGLAGVDPWPESRDARAYAGPHPVVAHPPCARWGRYWWGGPSSPRRYKLGDDGGCFEAALAAVRQWGGVLEHPEGSAAWRVFGLAPPPRAGGWVPAGDGQGFTCCVEQGHYGHPGQKRTWLYAVDAALPELRWGDCGLRETRGRGARPASRIGIVERLSKQQRAATPHEFRDVLLTMARSVKKRRRDAAAR